MQSIRHASDYTRIPNRHVRYHDEARSPFIFNSYFLSLSPERARLQLRSDWARVEPPSTFDGLLALSRPARSVTKSPGESRHHRPHAEAPALLCSLATHHLARAYKSTLNAHSSSTRASNKHVTCPLSARIRSCYPTSSSAPALHHPSTAYHSPPRAPPTHALNSRHDGS